MKLQIKEEILQSRFYWMSFRMSDLESVSENKRENISTFLEFDHVNSDYVSSQKAKVTRRFRD